MSSEITEENICSACGYEVAQKSDLHKAKSFDNEEVFLCDICHSTFAGKLATHPGIAVRNEDIIQTVAFSVNLILQAIEKKGS